MTVRIDLSYDGTDFHGFARQPDVTTVQGTIEAALQTILGPVELVVAGRTDAGVHARHQVLSLEAANVDIERLAGSLNRMLPSSIAVHRAMLERDGFSARFDAIRRTYRYFIDRSAVPSPFDSRYAWHSGYSLDVDRMQQVAGQLVGVHDFSSFCRKAPGRSMVREVFSAEFTEEGSKLVFEVVGRAFCHQQIRSFVSFLVEVGRGRREPETITEVLAARDRSVAAGAAPSRGLFLWEIRYPSELAEAPDLP